MQYFAILWAEFSFLTLILFLGECDSSLASSFYFYSYLDNPTSFSFPWACLFFDVLGFPWFNTLFFVKFPCGWDLLDPTRLCYFLSPSTHCNVPLTLFTLAYRPCSMSNTSSYKDMLRLLLTCVCKHFMAWVVIPLSSIYFRMYKTLGCLIHGCFVRDNPSLISLPFGCPLPLYLTINSTTFAVFIFGNALDNEWQLPPLDVPCTIPWIPTYLFF